MRTTRLRLLPLLAVLACVDNSSADDVEECDPNSDAFVGLFNAEEPWTSVGNSYCDEIFVCADAAAAETLSEQLGLQCQAHIGSSGCNGDGDVKCILATEVLVTEQHIADACTALTVPNVVEVFCAKG